MRFIRFSLVVGLILAIQFTVDADDRPHSTDSATTETAVTFETAWKEIHSVVGALSRHHLSPQTKQQLYLSACRGMYAANEEMPPADLCQQFSEMTKDSEYRAKLESTWLEMQKAAPESKLLRDVAMEAMMFGNSSGTRFISGEENRVRAQLAENQYVGIGIQVALHEEYPMIAKPFYGGAAYEAGAVTGDLIIAVDDVPTLGREFGKVINDLRGLEGTELTVTVRHKDKPKSKDHERKLKMVRAVIPIDSVIGEEREESGTWKLTHSKLPKHIAYLKINTIVGSTAAELIAASNRMVGNGFKGVVLDCREIANNSEAEIHHANMVADAFLGEAKIGDLISPKNTSAITTTEDHHFKDMEIVVLTTATGQKATVVPVIAGQDPMVNVASAPVMLVLSALQRHGRAKIVGHPIATNGICLKTVELDDCNAALRNIPYAIARPASSKAKTPTKTMVRLNQGASNSPTLGRFLGDARIKSGAFSLLPDVEVKNEQESLTAAAKIIDALKK